MATIELTEDSFESTINDNDIVILDFWAAWCGPCRAFAPVFEAASESNDDVVFGKIDTEAEQEIAASFAIQSIPTLAIFREGVVVYSQPGALPAAAIDELLEQVRTLDMEEVHREIAEHEAAHADGSCDHDHDHDH